MERDGSSIVAIGASAGGIQALLTLIGELPAAFSGTIFVVVHIGRSRSVLPALLERAGPLPASHAKDGETFLPGHIYVAPPDHHMLVRQDHIELSHGPRENHSRPAIDPLFRSAAISHGPSTIGIVLSGALSDGSAGLLAIKEHGGVAIVQDPAEAIIGTMPESALRAVKTDYILPAEEIGRLLGTSLDNLITMSERTVTEREIDSSDELITRDMRQQEKGGREGEITMYTCPDCGGSLWQAASGEVTRFQCHVGHTWNVESLLGNKSVELEAALWAGVRLLEERATLTRQLAAHIRASDAEGPCIQGIDEQAMLDEQRADVIRGILDAPMNQALQIVATGDALQND
jgi:two-component system chemotaxis response regulator CheB